MTKPDFRELLIVLVRWATAAKDYPTYQAKHGKPPPNPDAELGYPFIQLYSVAGMTLGFFKANGWRVRPLPRKPTTCLPCFDLSRTGAGTGGIPAWC